MFSGVFHKPKTSELQPKIKRVRRNLRIKPTKNGRWYSAETQQTSFLVLHSLSHFKGEHSKMSRFQHTLLLQHIPLQECSNGVLKQQVVVQPFSWNWKKQQTYRHLYIYMYRCIWPPSFCVNFSKHIEQHMPKTCTVINQIHFFKGLKKPQCEPQPPPDLHQTGLGYWFGHFFFDPCQDWLDISPVERLVQIPIGSLC